VSLGKYKEKQELLVLGIWMREVEKLQTWDCVGGTLVNRWWKGKRPIWCVKRLASYSNRGGNRERLHNGKG